MAESLCDEAGLQYVSRAACRIDLDSVDQARIDRASAVRKIGDIDELENASSLDAVKLLLDGRAPAIGIIAFEEKTRCTGFLCDESPLRAFVVGVGVVVINITEAFGLYNYLQNP